MRVSVETKDEKKKTTRETEDMVEMYVVVVVDNSKK
jgi:hypothetical protein